MAHSTPPSFEEWVEYCFAQAYRDWSGQSTDEPEVIEARERRFVWEAAPWIADNLARLFESPAFLADRYSDEQIADATWFVFGISSQYIAHVRNGPGSKDAQARCIRSVATMYTDLFDRVCCERGTQPDANLHGDNKIDIAVYMIWDMDMIQYIPVFPEKSPHLVDPALYVLETVLERCVTSSCIISALHGIGHIIQSREYAGDLAVVTRLQTTIDGLLTRRRLPEWLEEYATYARDGAVM